MLEKIELAIKNMKLAILGTQDTRLVLIYISVNKCILSHNTLSVSTCMMFKLQITPRPTEHSRLLQCEAEGVCFEAVDLRTW